MSQKNQNYYHIFNTTVNLIKPPFLIKSVSVPKKIKKKIKQKYILKVIYKNDTKRIKNTFKQLHYHSNNFISNTIGVRLYKSILFTFLEGNQSQLFQLKTTIFKKFFKF